jgi:DNA mismatch repair protein MutS
MSDGDLTPLMRQYQDIKQRYRDAILFFRVGDFYEMFYEDAEEASRLLAIALTSRDKHRADPVPLCGVPYHAATGYIAKLLRAGRTVALCEQVEDPKSAKGLVRRDVVRLYTPGTLIDSELLPPAEAHRLAMVCATSPTMLGLASLDLSTGDFRIAEFRGDQAGADLQDELVRVEPKELLYAADLPSQALNGLMNMRNLRLCAQDTSGLRPTDADRLLRDLLGVSSLDAFGCRDCTAGLQAAAGLVRYIRATQPTAPLSHLRRIRVRRAEHEMHLDGATIRNLELLKSFSPDQPTGHPTTLLAVLDRTVTTMGGRLLREWLVRPLTQRATIEERSEAVAELLASLPLRTTLRHTLARIQDIARLSTRVSLGTANPRDLLALKESAAALPLLRDPLALCRCALLGILSRSWDDLADVHELIDQSILPDAPVSSRDGGIIKDGRHPQLDELRAACRDGKGWLTQLEARERERSGIDSLKVRYNQVFGYYIEVTKANLARVPPDFVRKQTLANAERFTTPELKELEERITGAEVKLAALEQELFERVRAQVAKETARLQAMAGTIAVLDVLLSLAEAAAAYRYARPAIDEGGTLRIVQGRHPVVERLGLPGGFVPNDTLLDLEQHRLLVITGPNMAGKSTYLRQIALIVLMAQMGGFVPAQAATIGLVDRIFTRIGASDNLAAGQSTFMVEMTETAQILNCATARSLILLDEIGRGTSTYDGLSIAWAVAEYIQDRRRLGARTLFATHYHELTDLARHRQGVQNHSVAVQEQNGEVVFLRKIVAGGADRSYGIHVAQLAGLPPEVIARAQEVLAQLEGAASTQPVTGTGTVADDGASPLVAHHPSPITSSPDPTLPPPHPIIEEVRQMDLFSMTPLEALNRLADLQRRLEQESNQ